MTPTAYGVSHLINQTSNQSIDLPIHQSFDRINKKIIHSTSQSIIKGLRNNDHARIKYIRWRHDTVRFSALCEGNPSVTIGFLSQKAVTRSFDTFVVVSFKYFWNKSPSGQWLQTPRRSGGVSVMKSYICNELTGYKEHQGWNVHKT